MKYLLIALSFISFSASAQVDSGSYYLPFQMKAKYAKVMVPEEPIYLEDKNLLDTLKKAIGSGNTNQNDSLTTINLRAATYLRLVQKGFMDKNVIAYYDFALDFFTAPLTAVGYSGVIPAIDYYAASGTANQKIAAKWLQNNLYPLISAKAALLNEDMQKGLERLKKVRTQN